MSEEIPQHLENTYELISRTFPNGIEESEYYPLLAVLYDYLSDRNLSEVMSLVTGSNIETVLNDLYKTQSINKPSSNQLEEIKNKLLPFGFEDWKNED